MAPCQKTTLQFTCLSETFLLIQESNEFIDKKKENQLKIIVTDADEKESDAGLKETCADEKETCAVIIYIMCNIAECVLPRQPTMLQLNYDVTTALKIDKLLYTDLCADG